MAVDDAVRTICGELGEARVVGGRLRGDGDSRDREFGPAHERSDPFGSAAVFELEVALEALGAPGPVQGSSAHSRALTAVDSGSIVASSVAGLLGRIDRTMSQVCRPGCAGSLERANQGLDWIEVDRCWRLTLDVPNRRTAPSDGVCAITSQGLYTDCGSPPASRATIRAQSSTVTSWLKHRPGPSSASTSHASPGAVAYSWTPNRIVPTLVSDPRTVWAMLFPYRRALSAERPLVFPDNRAPKDPCTRLM